MGGYMDTTFSPVTIIAIIIFSFCVRAAYLWFLDLIVSDQSTKIRELEETVQQLLKESNKAKTKKAEDETEK